ncbi:MAG: PH domain-containing protein [Deltaproteobacteria bacterium]|nr:PH domain-containing protein [Deltaproteobacteria bacterium]
MSNLPAPKPGLMPGASGGEELLFSGSPAVVQGFGGLLVAILTLGLSLIYALLKARSVHYKITTERIVIERGMFSKRMEQLDLYRVVDYVVERPIGQRIMGTGNIVLEAMDKTTPEVRIEGIKTDVVALYERLRYATEQAKKKRGVRVIDAEPAGG